MLPIIIIFMIIVVLIVLWIISTQRRLVVLDENVNNSMSQIGVQLSSRFDALMTLLDLTKSYAGQEGEILIEKTKTKRSAITGKSTPDDVLHQERVIAVVLCRIFMFTVKYPELKENQNYAKAMSAVEIFENMVRTSQIIYNDSVAKLNREIRMFPVSMIAAILGFRQREFILSNFID